MGVVDVVGVVVVVVWCGAARLAITPKHGVFGAPGVTRALATCGILLLIEAEDPER